MTSWNTAFSTERREEEPGKEGGERPGEILGSLQYVFLHHSIPIPSVSVSKKRKNRPRRKGDSGKTGATKRKMSPGEGYEAISLLDSPRGEKLRKSCHGSSHKNSDPALNECKLIKYFSFK